MTFLITFGENFFPLKMTLGCFTAKASWHRTSDLYPKLALQLLHREQLTESDRSSVSFIELALSVSTIEIANMSLKKCMSQVNYGEVFFSPPYFEKCNAVGILRIYSLKSERKKSWKSPPWSQNSVWLAGLHLTISVSNCLHHYYMNKKTITDTFV